MFEAGLKHRKPGAKSVHQVTTRGLVGQELFIDMGMYLCNKNKCIVPKPCQISVD